MPKILLNWVPTQSDFELMRKTLPDVEFEVPPWQKLGRSRNTPLFSKNSRP